MRMRLHLLALVVTLLCVPASQQQTDEYYQYVRPEVYVTPARRYYPDNHDFTDYSMHYTRSDPASRNSAAQPPPSGPYFAHELKSYYHHPGRNPAPVQNMIYQTSWNLIDSEGNDYSPYPRPIAQTLQSEEQLAWQHRPVRKPIAKKPVRKKQKKRPVHSGVNGQKHPNNIDKFSEAPAAQSIAAAYPNGVMGTLSLMAGLVWYMVNKSATPVVKMRQYSGSSSRESDEDDSKPETAEMAAFNELMDHWWTSLKQTDCQQRAICELVSEYSLFSSAARWSKSAFRAPMMQKVMQTLKEDGMSLNEKSTSMLTSLFRAASHGERGVDCSAFYPRCSLRFRMEARDRR